MVGRLIPAGTGYTYHQTRKAKRKAASNEQITHTVTASDVEHALSEALNADNHDQ